MRLINNAAIFALALGACAFAQQYEVGGLAGAGFVNGVNVAAPAGTATTGFKSGAAFGALVGHNLYSHLGGEIRYTYRDSPLKISSGTGQTSFSALSHALHYDVVLHPNRRGAAVVPFVAVGGGIRIFEGTGKETAFQPLSQYAYLTKTHEVKPLLTAGAGVKIRLKQNVYLRTEFRDYVTPFPKQVIAPAPGAKIGSWLQDFVPMAGLSFTF